MRRLNWPRPIVLVLLAVVYAAPFVSTNAYGQLVTRADPDRVQLEPGGRSVSVTLSGQGLEAISGLEVRDGFSEVRGWAVQQANAAGAGSISLASLAVRSLVAR